MRQESIEAYGAASPPFCTLPGGHRNRPPRRRARYHEPDQPPKGASAMNPKTSAVNRRNFLKGTAAAGLGAATAAAQVRFDHTADVVIVGAGASGLPAAIMARDHGASVIVIDANHDIGGHAMLSGGRIPLGGGTSLQKKYGVADSADQVYLDHTNHRDPTYRFADRDLVRVWADENAPTFE